MTAFLCGVFSRPFEVVVKRSFRNAKARINAASPYIPVTHPHCGVNGRKWRLLYLHA